ncbi:MAG: acyl-ACP--UDP-N-acetylglucosamine O-acyltransferase [Planctomyces sp.]|nr:acyl-ACP--UDP-N-acetylglucosamine O-acyltransferase [Planctomyces sp.]
MPTKISRFADVHSDARIGEDVQIGPFCVVGKNVSVGEGCVLHSHVVLIGRTTIGRHNVFHPNCVIGGEPQDKSYVNGETEVRIGDRNQFREGVTVNRGAEKEDGATRIGSRNLLMANAHVAHNCRIDDDAILVNGVLLGGHVHVQDRAIISGNSVVHHFSTIGTLAFVSGGCRVPFDIPPYMLSAGSDNPEIKTVNLIGMRRAGIPARGIDVIKTAYRRVFRDHCSIFDVRQELTRMADGDSPPELAVFLDFIERQRNGRFGRQREGSRGDSSTGDSRAA